MIKAVIFDLDDTLISENEYIKSGFHAVSKYINKEYNLQEEKVYKDLIDISKNNKKNVFNRLLEYYKISYDQERIIELINIYRNHKPDIKLYPDAIELINNLKTMNIKIGIITDGYIETQKAKLNAINAESIFDEIIITEELGREYWKPNPKAFEILKEKFNVDYSKMIYIGDNPQKDFYIKKYHPIITVRICKNEAIYLNENYLEDIKEDYKINGLLKVLEIIKELR